MLLHRRGRELPAIALLEEFGADRVLVDGVVAGDDGETALGDEVVFLVLVGVVADDRSVRNVDVAVDDGETANLVRR